MSPAARDVPSHREEAALNLMHYFTHGHHCPDVLEEMRETVDHIVDLACERVAERLLKVTPPSLPGASQVQNLIVEALRGVP